MKRLLVGIATAIALFATPVFAHGGMGGGHGGGHFGGPGFHHGYGFHGGPGFHHGYGGFYRGHAFRWGHAYGVGRYRYGHWGWRPGLCWSSNFGSWISCATGLPY